MTQVRCDSCRFWKKLSNRDDIGECHRHAPSPTKGGFENKLLDLTSMLAWHFASDQYPEGRFEVEEEILEAAWWPATWGIDFCGEHQAGSWEAGGWC